MIFKPSLSRLDANAMQYPGVIPVPPANRPKLRLTGSAILLDMKFPKPLYLVFPTGPLQIILSPTLTYSSKY